MSPAEIFDKDYWKDHWDRRDEKRGHPRAPSNPYLESELDELKPGTALDAGCGEGNEAIWLAGRGWRVTAVDIAAAVLSRAAAKPHPAGLVDWIEADLSVWQPGKRFDLVTTFYAHSASPQLEFYERVAEWVAPGGTLLIVGHRDSPGHDHGHGQGHDGDHRSARDSGADSHPGPPAEATVTVGTVTALFDPSIWEVVTAAEADRVRTRDNAGSMRLRDVIVRARLIT